MLIRTFIIMVFSFTLISEAQSEIYKCTVDGVATFSQQPCDNSAPHRPEKPHDNSKNSNTVTDSKKYPSSDDEKALSWKRFGVKTCTLYQTHKDALNELTMMKSLAAPASDNDPNSAKLLRALMEAKHDPELQQLIEDNKTALLQDTCDSGAAGKCHDFVVIFNGVVEERYYTNDHEKLESLRKECEGGGGAKFTMMK